MQNPKPTYRREVEAYFCCWCFPGKHCEDPDKQDRATVSIKYTDGTWEEIFRLNLRTDEGCSRRSEKILAKAVLEHFLQGPASTDQVMMLVTMPATSLCRLEPQRLEIFRYMKVQLELPGLSIGEVEG